MLERGKMERGIFEIVDTESLVPAEHLLRKIDAAVDFNKIYDMVEPLYCADNGRPSVDPGVLFKMVLIQHLYGLGSLKKLKKRKKEAKKKTVTVSTTDPDCGLFVKGDHKKQLAYETHTACDVHGVVLAVEVTPGNVHDSVPFDDVYDKVVEQFPDVHAFVADSAYKAPHICKKVFSDNRVLSTAYKRPQTKSGHEWWQYVYDEHFDCIICPEYQVLNYSTTNRDGYREYKSDPKICANCPTKHLCTKNKDCVKTVTRHIWKEYEEMADDIRYTPIYQKMYKARKETIERVFADAKEKHGLRYTRYTGLAQVTNWVKLTFTAMNLKKFAKWRWKDTHSSYLSCIISIIFHKNVWNPCLA